MKFIVKIVIYWSIVIMIIKEEEFMIRRVGIILPSIKHGKDLKPLNNDIILYTTTNHNNM